MRPSPRTRFALAVVFALFAVPSAAHADVYRLATVESTTPIVAYHGHVVWSAYDAASARWSLVQWHDGAVTLLPAAPRSVPFDVDVGPDARGRAVAVYSRCLHEPDPAPWGGLYPDWMTASGCNVYELSLDGGTERRVTAVSTRAAAETTPAIWRGAIAFARRGRGEHVARVLLWRPGAGTRTLRGGSRMACPRRSACPVQRFHAGPDALDLGPVSAAVSWRVSSGGVPGQDFGVELRSDTLDGRRSSLAVLGVVGAGACRDDSVNWYPTSPNAVGTRLLYAQLTDECGDGRYGDVREFMSRGSLEAGVLFPNELSPEDAVAVARDGNDLYWVDDPLLHSAFAPAAYGCRPGGGYTCNLMRSDATTLGRAFPRQVEPLP